MSLIYSVEDPVLVETGSCVGEREMRSSRRNDGRRGELVCRPRHLVRPQEMRELRSQSVGGSPEVRATGGH